MCKNIHSVSNKSQNCSCHRKNTILLCWFHMKFIILWTIWIIIHACKKILIFFPYFWKSLRETIFDGGASLPDDDLNKYGIHHFTFNSKCCVCVCFFLLAFTMRLFMSSVGFKKTENEHRVCIISVLDSDERTIFMHYKRSRKE